MRGLFITGTDTGVGKTVIACALAAWCRRRGVDVGVMKPVATGGRRLREGLISDDALRMIAAADVHDRWSLVNPVCFREPLAPWTAARRAGTTIRLDGLLRAFRALRDRHAFLIVEGVGGLMVPLGPRTTVGELARWFGLPLLLVARPGLGTLNHSLLTLERAHRLRLSVQGMVLNHTHPPPRGPVSRLAQRTNPEILKRLTRVPILGTMPFRPDLLRGSRLSHQQIEGLSRLVSQHLDGHWLNQLIDHVLPK